MDLAAIFLGGLGAALVASGIAYLGARYLQIEATRRRERGATRAVYYEVGAIASSLIATVEDGLWAVPSVSTATYERAVGDLAVFLAPADFDKVALAYYTLQRLEQRAPGTAEVTDLPVVINYLEAARDVLGKAAFTEAEMKSRRASGQRS